MSFTHPSYMYAYTPALYYCISLLLLSNGIVIAQVLLLRIWYCGMLWGWSPPPPEAEPLATRNAIMCIYRRLLAPKVLITPPLFCDPSRA